MPDQPVPNFEQALESDIKHLEGEIKTRREYPEWQGVSGKEILKHSIQSMSPSASSGQVPPPQKSPNVIEDPLPDYAKDAPPETKLEIEQLLEMAFREGIVKANAEAAKSSAFVVDAFHDSLVGKLYPEFKKRGILE